MCTNGGSRNSVPLRVIPERGKVCENSGESSTEKSPDVFHDRAARSKLANKAHILSPQAGSLTLQTVTRAGKADVLTGETAAHSVDSFDSIGSKPGSVKLSDIFINGNRRPVLGQYAPAPGVDLAKSDRPEAGALKSKAEATNTTEQV